MIVVICGPYRNCGDHLIGSRGRSLLKKFVDGEVVTVDRKLIGADEYDLFNRSRAVLLCGGPAYQREMYPKVYPLDLERITAPVVPFGLGWKSPAEKTPQTFKFADGAMKFIHAIHERIELSSVRDPMTLEVLELNGVKNVSMTGCPAWYDLENFEKAYKFIEEPRSIVFSMPAIMQPGVLELMQWLTRRFPNSVRVASFHHGLVPTTTVRAAETAYQFMRFSSAATSDGWKISSLAGSLSKMEALYTQADFHIGYRVHAHLFCLSRRTASILINEDIRGVGQAKALGAANLLVSGGNIEPIKKEVDDHFDSRGETVRNSIATMRATFPTMRRFLDTIK